MWFFHPWQRAFLVAVLLAPLALTGGCGIFSPDEVDDGGSVEPPAPYPLATTQDILISNFVRAYNERNYEKYRDMLDFQFLFYLSDEDVAQGAEARFDRARDLQATWNMFNGEPGLNPQTQEPQPPIRSIDLKLIPEANGDWTDQVGQDFLGTTMRRYEVDMTVEYTDSSISAVTGLQEFYAVSAAHDNGDGTATTIYLLKFWRDLGKEGL